MLAASVAVTGAMLGVRARTRRSAQSLVLSPDETYDAVVAVGEARLDQPTQKILRDGLVTGFYIGFGGVLCSTVGGCATSLAPGLQRFLFGAVGFPLSIFLTTIAGGQGFTPNLGVMASAFIRKGGLAQRSISSLGTKLKVLGLAYTGNTVGLLTIAYLANLAALPAVPAAIEIAKHKCELSFLQVLVRGVLGGWLIGLAVWTSVAARDVFSKFITIWLCISTYVICQYEHCLANIFFVPCAIFAGAPITWQTFLTANLIPSTLGNMIGGMLMLAGSQRAALGSNKPPPPSAGALPAGGAPALK
jgi:formate/nitrite transporter